MMFGMVLKEKIEKDENGNDVKKSEKIKSREG
jgi:hypothetical protein